MHLLNSFLFALGLTIIIELIVAVVFGYRNKISLLTVILINIITNPIANWIVVLNRATNTVSETILIVFVELAVVIVEWKLLTAILKKDSMKMFLLSLSMNAASYLFGLILFRFAF
jgi:hypothetical protein